MADPLLLVFICRVRVARRLDEPFFQLTQGDGAECREAQSWTGASKSQSRWILGASKVWLFGDQQVVAGGFWAPVAGCWHIPSIAK